MPMSSAHPTLPWNIRIKTRIINLFYAAVLRPNHTVNRRVTNFTLPKTPPNPTTPINNLITYDLTIHTHPAALSLRIFSPLSSHQRKIPLIIYLHGGGFIFQTAADKVCHAFATTLSLHLPAVVASLSYRLSPEHKYPAQHDDVRHMLHFLNSHPHLLPTNTDLSNTFLAGESAGANLAHFATPHFPSLHSLTLTGLISIQPFFGGEKRTPSEIRQFNGPMIPVPVTDWMWKAYLPPGSDRDHPACNINGPNAEIGSHDDLEGFPRSLVVVGGFDPMQDRQRRYCEWLRGLGKEVEVVEIENGIHGFYVFPELEETNLLYEEVKKFVYKTINH